MIERLRHFFGLCKEPATFREFLNRIASEHRPGAVIECSAADLHWLSCRNRKQEHVPNQPI